MQAREGTVGRSRSGQKARKPFPWFLWGANDLWGCGGEQLMEEDPLDPTAKNKRKKKSTDSTLSGNLKHAANVCARLCRHRHPLFFLGPPSSRQIWTPFTPPPPLEVLRFPEAHLCREEWRQRFSLNSDSETGVFLFLFFSNQ